MPRTQARPTARSYDAAMKRHIKSEAHRKVALAGGGARETARRGKRIYAAFICLDCKVNTQENGEYYMVHDAVWKSVVPKPGMLCIGCLEKRLERGLTPADFSPYPINDGIFFPQSERLRARLRGVSEAPLLGRSHTANLAAS